MCPRHDALPVRQQILERIDTVLVDRVDRPDNVDFRVVVVEGNRYVRITVTQREAEPPNDVDTRGGGIEAVGEETEFRQVVETDEVLTIDDAVVIKAGQRFRDRLVVAKSTSLCIRVIQRGQEVDLNGST